MDVGKKRDFIDIVVDTLMKYVEKLVDLISNAILKKKREMAAKKAENTPAAATATPVITVQTYNTTQPVMPNQPVNNAQPMGVVPVVEVAPAASMIQNPPQVQTPAAFQAVQTVVSPQNTQIAQNTLPTPPNTQQVQ